MNDATTLTANGADTYLWNNGSTDPAISISPVYKTLYQVSGTAVNGCSSFDTLTVFVNSLPNISVSAPTSVCEGSTASLVASGANSYIWNGSIPGAAYQPTITKDLSYCSWYDTIIVKVLFKNRK